jgi:vacuolar-type H+-ATPase subunit H
MTKTSTSTTSSQEEYIESLKQIKETEQKTQAEIESFRKHTEHEMRNLEEDLRVSIDNAKQEGKRMVEKSIEDSKNKALSESNMIVADAKSKSKSISFNLDKPLIKEVMDIVFSDL